MEQGAGPLFCEISWHQKAEQSYMEEGVTLLTSAKDAQRLFESRPAADKRRLLNFVLSNSTWSDAQLEAKCLIRRLTMMREEPQIRRDVLVGWAFLDTYRTACLAPSPEIREIFEQVRTGKVLEYA
jgi:hypothetical protein